MAMNEKILNTRIALKIDTLENWDKSTLGLKKGELAFATVAATAGTGLTEPVVMVKIGEDGIKTFKDLSYNFYAKASDVLAACKTEAGLKAFVNGVIADAGIATNEALTALSGKVTTAEEDIDDLEAAVEVLNGDASTEGSIAKQIADAIAALANVYETKGTAQTLIEGLDVTDTAVTGKYVSAVSEVDGKVVVSREDLPTYTLGSGSANGTVSFNGADIAVTGLGSAAYTDSKAYDAAGSAATAKSEAIAAAKTETETQVNALKNGDVKANADAIAAIKDHATVDSFADVMTEMAKYQIAGDYATKTEAQDYATAAADGKDAAIAEAKKAGTDAAAALETYKTANDAAVALKADQTALEAEVARATKAEGDLQNALNLLIDSTEGDETKLNSIKELATWIEEHGSDAAEMAEAIEGNTTAIGNEVTRAKAEEERLAGLIGANAADIDTNEKAIAKNIEDIAKNAADIAKLNAADGKVANAVNADKLGNVEAANYLLKTDAPGYADILTKTVAAETYQPKGDYATAAQGAKAETAVQPAALNDYYTKTAADAEFMNSTETDSAINAKITALNLGATYEPIGAETRAKAYADGLAGNYATSAQGAKADTALQQADIVTGTANGTIAVKGTDVAVKGLGSAAYTEASAYATAAQGAKADTALQEITAGEGLKVTDKNSIGFDPDVVFVFDCGNSGVVAE